MEERVVPKPVEREMQEAYLDYAMSVIVSRALPDVRDGLKPVQRRVLVAMNDLGLAPNRPYRKCAKICGDTSGNYHPHGEAVIYPTLVRLAQPWVMRYPLVDGQGNFGSVDDDPPAAMRYCVVGDTLVVTDRGLLRIDQLSSEGGEDIAIRVLSRGGVVNRASKWFDCGVFPTRRVVTRRGYEVTGTTNHPLLVCVPDEQGRPAFTWKTIQEIAPGDWLVLDRSDALWPGELVDLRPYHPDLPAGSRADRHVLPERLTEGLAFLLGALAAEGTFRENMVEFTNTDGEFANAFREVWCREFPTCRLHSFLRKPAGFGRKPFWQMQVASQQVVAFLKNIGLCGKSAERGIPAVVLQSPQKVVAAFLRGLYEGDGAVERSGRSLLRVGLAAKNRVFLRQVQTVLLRFGIVSTLYHDSREKYRLIVAGRTNLERFARHIGFVSAAKRRKLLAALAVHSGRALSRTDFVPFLAEYVRRNAARGQREWLAKHNFDRPERLAAALPRLAQVLPAEDATDLASVARNNYFFDQVVRVEDAGDQRVYSIRVDSPCHSFVANGFVNHNTEARLTPVAMEMLADLDKDTVDFVPNFDQTRREPVVLPARIPNLLVNGASGIAVGMATNIPPHNLGEVVDALVALIDDPDLPTEELLRIVKGPDFPTGGLILGRDGIREAYTTGRGSILMRAKATVEELRGGRTAIVVTELPYMVNKAALIARIAELVRDKKVQGIADLRDESDREGMRVVIELRREANPQVVLNQLYKHTQMQTSFGAILLALVGGVPRQLTLRDLLTHYLDHRREIVTRRTRFELARAEERAHVLEGLKVALDHLDAVIQLIRSSRDVAAARDGLVQRFGLSERQADAILEMRLARLTALERSKVEEEYRELLKAIAYYQDVLRDPRKVAAIVREELLEIKAKYADPRRTRITSGKEAVLEEEDLVPDTEVVITLTRHGYVKRVPLETYRAQRRGGKGIVGATAREEDFVEHVVVTHNHAYLLFFTNRGRVYRVRAFEVPESGRTARGTGLMNLVGMAVNERVNAVIPIRSFEDAGYLFMATRRGMVKRTGLMEFVNARRAGIVALHLQEGDELVGVRLTDGRQEVILATRQGQSIRFKESGVREMGRTAAGVVGIRLRPGDEVVGLAVASEKPELLTVTDLGYGKRTPVSQYRLQARGGYGVRNIRLSPKNGRVVAVRAVAEDDEVLLATESGQILRTLVREISTVGRSAQGVRVMRLEPGDRVSAVAVVEGER